MIRPDPDFEMKMGPTYFTGGANAGYKLTLLYSVAYFNE
jgi:hypothetical protein